ncbi:MAG: hypothetical protein HYT94_05370 [Parcubacteria group bacterium]|nr:hypothetical protein [Parcubacteria group bacterium]
MQTFEISNPQHIYLPPPVHRFRGDGTLAIEWGEEGKVEGEKAPPIRPSCVLKIVGSHPCTE